MMAYHEELPASEIALRSLYMRIFRTHIEMMPGYSPPPCDAPQVAVLLGRGHIEETNGLYRLTQSGTQAWAEMNRHLICNRSGMLWATVLRPHLSHPCE